MVKKIYRYVYAFSPDNEGIIEEKEVKKVSRPYLETKIVKVRKKEKCRMFKECYRCGQEYICMMERNKRKGNWVNGENLDKIKFPCFCSYFWGSCKFYGSINKRFMDDGSGYIYNLIDIDNQTNCVNSVCSMTSLKKLIEHYNIHILKGKIIIFDEEK